MVGYSKFTNNAVLRGLLVACPAMHALPFTPTAASRGGLAEPKNAGAQHNSLPPLPGPREPCSGFLSRSLL